jgi:hypothetical protein
LTKINALAPEIAIADLNGMEQAMMDSVIIVGIAFFVVFGVTVLVVDWLQHRAHRKRR